MSTAWHVTGEYMEACSCDFLCPCLPKNATTPATHDFCKVAMAFEIDSGQFGDTDLAGVRFVMVAQSKAVMTEGDWIAGLIVDEGASEAQVAAVAAITTAEGNGPLALFAPLIGEFRGIERRPIAFDRHPGGCSVRVDGMLEQQVEGVESQSAPGEHVALDNTFHPVNPRLNLATAVRNMINAFGIEWRDPAQRTNGHFAPFDWQGVAA